LYEYKSIFNYNIIPKIIALKSFLLLFVSLVLVLETYSQNVGVGTTAPAAKLDITSTNSGILIPRIALTGSNDATTVPSPMTSTMIYNTATITGTYAITPGFYYWTGSAWSRFMDGTSAPADSNIYNTDGTLTGNRTVTMAADNLLFNTTTGKIGVNNSAPGAMLHLQSPTNNGYNVPSGDIVMARYWLDTTNTRASAIFHYNNAFTSSDNMAFGVAGNGGSNKRPNDTSQIKMIIQANGNVGIGTQSPAQKLEVTGTTKTTNFDMTSGAAAGYILQSDASGNATWVAPSAITTGTTNTLASATNTITSTVNGVAATAPAVNTNTFTLAGTSVTSTVNGVAASPLDISSIDNNIYNTDGTLTGARTMTMAGNTLILNGGTLSTNQDASIHGITVGEGAGSQSTNTAAGNGALPANTSGTQNSAVGYNALHANTTGGNNAAFGMQALNLNTGGSSNVAIGHQALQTNATGSNNTAIGFQALYANTASFNTATGYLSLYNNTTGSNNVASGYGSLSANTTGGNNAAYGHQALNGNISGIDNVATGFQALYNNTANNNTASGFQALYANTSGTNNTASGYNAMKNLTGNSNNNTATGVNAMLNNTGGSGNAAYGFDALQNNTTGTNNTALGNQALFNGAGSFNTAVGSGADIASTYTNATAVGAYAYAGASNTVVIGSINGVNGATATANIGIGTTTPTSALQVVGKTTTTNFQMTAAPTAGYIMQTDASGNGTWVAPSAVNSATSWSILGNNNIVDGTNFIGTTNNVALTFKVNNIQAGRLDNALYNAFYGVGAGHVGTTGSYNTAMGYNSFLANTSGNYNAANGAFALGANTTGIFNTAMGFQSLQFNTTGNFNTGTGAYALNLNTTGINNTATGVNSMLNNTTGNYNTSNGFQAFFTNTTGYANTANGDSSLGSNTTGYQNTGDGYNALLHNTTGSNNTALGYKADVASAALTNATAIGANAQAGSSNTLILGGITGVNSGTSVNVGIGTNTPSTPLEVFTNAPASVYVEVGSFLSPNNTVAGDGTMIRVGSSATTNNAAQFRFYQGASGSASNFAQIGLYGNSTGPAILPNGNVGISTTTPAYPLDVVGSINTSTGYKVAGAAATGTYLRGNGTNFVGSAIQALDLSLGISGTTNTIPKFTGANSIGNSSITDNGTMVTSTEPVTINTGGTQVSLIVNGTTSNEIALQNSGAYKLEIGYVIAANNFIIGAAAGDIAIRQTGGGKMLFSSSASGTTNDLTLSAGNVGIGTTTPTSTLQVAGKTTTTNFDMTSGAAAGYILQSDASGNGSWVAPSTITTGTTHTLTNTTNTITSTVNGVSATAPAVNTDLLTLSGTSITSTVNGVASTPLDISAIDKNIYNSNGTLTAARTVTMAGNNLGFTGGNVGINTTSPSTPLEAYSNAAANSTIEVGSFLAPNNTGAGDGTMIRVGTSASANNAAQFRFYPGTSGSASNYAQIGIYGNGTGPAILPSGNVGIGTTTPTAALDVFGAVMSENGQATHAQGAYLEWNKDNTSGYTYLLNQKGLGSGGFVFGEVSAANAITTNMFISPAGNVGINNAAPAATLDVTGSLNVSTTASIAAWASQNQAANGYARMGGLLIQWGSLAYTTGAGLSATFPTAFTNLFSITATVDAGNNTGSGTNDPCKVMNPTTTTFQIGGQVGHSGDAVTKIRWIAIGN
jgi:hypothetical protein